MPLQLPSAVVRFPRRYPLAWLVLLIPLSLTLYYNFGYPNARYQTIPVPSESDLEEDLSANSSIATSQPETILLVSALFPLVTPEYDQKTIKRFLENVKTEIYFFTTPEFEPTVRSIRGRLPISIDSTLQSPFDISVLTNRQDTYLEMQRKDTQSPKPRPDVYAFRNAKAFLLAEALRRSNAIGKSPKYVFWTDCDSFKDKNSYRDWPGLDRVDAVWAEGRREGGARLEDMLFIPVREMPHPSMSLWNEDMGPIATNFVDSAFFGGMPQTILWWERKFYAYHDYYLDRLRTFVGKDESLLNSLVFLYTDRIITVWHNDPQSPDRAFSTPKQNMKDLILGDCGDPDRYFQFFLASQAEQDSQRQIWDGSWNWKFWEIERWFRSRVTCRVTRLSPMELLLQRLFGDIWRSPEATVSESLP